MVQGPFLVVILLLAILFVVIGISKFKIHPFLVLLLASYGVALSAGMTQTEIAGAITGGFGTTLTAIGIVIIAGVIIGTILEKSGAAITMADIVIRIVGPKRPSLAMSILGYIVSIPVFCDSGFVVLSSLNKSLAKKTKTSLVATSIALATGLYATHTLVPPTPGPIAAAANLELENLLLVFAIGMLVAIPSTIVGLIFANKVASKYQSNDVGLDDKLSYEEEIKKYGKLPSGWKAFAPIIVPILLMSLGSIARFPGDPLGGGLLRDWTIFFGTPVNALIIGMFFAFSLVPKYDTKILSSWVSEGITSSAMIIIVTATGGALGAVIRATPIGTYLGEVLQGLHVGILLPFVIAAALKSAQGSTTVSLVTTSAIMLPLLPALGLDSEMGKALTVAAIGAGAMIVSHANDSYFWVVSQFGGMDVKTAFRTLTVATLLQGISAIILVLLLTFVLL